MMKVSYPSYTLTDPECYEYVERSKGLDTSQSNTESSYSSTYAYNKSSEQDDELLPMEGQFNHTKNESSVAGPDAMWVLFSNSTNVSLTDTSKFKYHY